MDVAPPGYKFAKGRYFKFLLSTPQGTKLVSTCSAVGGAYTHGQQQPTARAQCARNSLA